MRVGGLCDRGFTLLEVLISVLILALGLVGVATLLITSSVHTEASLHRSQASTLAREIVERMRVNVQQAKAGSYDILTLPSLAQNCEGSGADCTAEQMRDHDLRVWAARVQALLPSGDAAISTDTSIDPVDITITMSWDDSRGQEAVVQQAFTFTLYGLDR